MIGIRTSSTNGSVQREQVRRSDAASSPRSEDPAVRALEAEVGVDRPGQLDVRPEGRVVVAEPDLAGRARRLLEQPRDVERGHGRGAACAFSCGSTAIGSPAGGGVTPSSLVGAVALVEHVDAALDAGQGLDALALEADEDAGRVLVGAAADLAAPRPGPIEDLGGALLGGANELTLLEHLDRLLLGPGDDRVTLLARTLGDPSGLLGDAARLADLLRHGDAQLVDQLQDGGLVEDDVVREGQLLAGGDQRLQSFDEEDDVRGRDPPWLGIIRVGRAAFARSAPRRPAPAAWPSRRRRTARPPSPATS